MNKFLTETLSKVILALSLISSLIMSSLTGIDDRLGSIFNYTLMIFAVIYLFLYFIRKRYKGKVDKDFIAICVFFTGYFFTTILNDKIIDNAKLFVLAIVQLFIIYQTTKEDKVFGVKVLKVFMSIIFLINFISIALYITGSGGNQFDGRYCGLYSGPNIGGAVVAFAGMFGIIFLLNEKRKSMKFIMILNIIICCFLLKIIASRAPIVIFLAFIVMFSFFYIRDNHNIYKGLCASVVSVLCFFMVCNFTSFLFSDARTRIIALKQTEAKEVTKEDNEKNSLDIDYEVSEKEPSNQVGENEVQKSQERDKENEKTSNYYRYQLIKYGVISGFQHPILGVGDRNVAEYVESISPFHLVGIEGGGIHNIYIQLFVANGLFGLASFVYITILTKLRVYKDIIMKKGKNKLSAQQIGMFCAYSCFLLYGMFESNLILSASVIATLFWIVSGLVNNYE